MLETKDQNQIKVNFFNMIWYIWVKLYHKLKFRLVITYFKKYFDEKDNLFPVLRLILPNQDKLRQIYGLKEKNLAKLYSDILSLPKVEKDMLKNWKNPNSQPSGVPVII